METVSIRKKVNETIIIQNSKRAFKCLLTTIIGMCCPFNLLGISSIDITYKFSLIWLFLVLFFAVRPALKRTGIKVFLRVNNQKITIKKQKVFGKVTKRNRANIYFIFFISKKIEYCIFYCSQIKKVYYETNNIMNY